MHITGYESNEEILAEIGERIRDARIAMPLTQAELARKSGVSQRTIANLEQGKGATLGNVLSVLRALGLAGNLDSLVAEQGPRPSDIARLGRKRMRAPSSQGGPASASAASSQWKWGDEQ